MSGNPSAKKPGGPGGGNRAGTGRWRKKPPYPPLTCRFSLTAGQGLPKAAVAHVSGELGGQVSSHQEKDGDHFLVAEILGRLERMNKDLPSVPDFSHVISVHLYPNFVRLAAHLPCNW